MIIRSCILQANRCGDLGQRVAMSIVRRRHPGAAFGMPVPDCRKIQDLTPNVCKFSEVDETPGQWVAAPLCSFSPWLRRKLCSLDGGTGV